VALDTFTLARKRFEAVTVVPDVAAYRAMRFLMEREKVVTELAASCTMAALQRNAERFGAADHVVLVLCGGNTSTDDLRTYHHLLGAGNLPQIPDV
jgi:threonine dehydratase